MEVYLKELLKTLFMKNTQKACNTLLKYFPLMKIKSDKKENIHKTSVFGRSFLDALEYIEPLMSLAQPQRPIIS